MDDCTPPTDEFAEEDKIFVPFLLKHSKRELMQIMQAPDCEQHYGVPISLARLAAEDQSAVDFVIASPRAVLPLMDAALLKAQHALLQEPLADRHLLSPKENVHARLSGLSLFLDKSCPAASPHIGEVSSAHIDKIITVCGTVVRAGAVKLLEVRRLYECRSCRSRFVVAADLEQGATMQLPAACPSVKAAPCVGASFKHCEDVSVFTNFQEVQVQGGRHFMAGAAAPRALTVILQDELADACQVGEVVQVTGVVLRQWGPTFPGIRCHVGLALQATALHMAGDRRTAVDVPDDMAASFQQRWDAAYRAGAPFAARDALLSSFCPQLCGLFSVKLASMLMLIGGISRRSGNDGDNPDSGGGPRSEIHFLLIGDPGTGKSQIQRFVSRLAPRAVLTSGKSSSAAGLTAAAVKDGVHWTLEAGALVLADGGVCCIDEFDAVRQADRAALHEAMEQQTCSVAKAGMVTTLHTRASVFGTCNPRGHKRYNPRRPLAEQLDISGPLLSRFDVVLLLLDDLNPAWDEAVADHILASHSRGPVAATPTPPPGGAEEGAWGVESLRQYISWAKTKFQPTMSPAAEEVLSGYYQMRRAAEGRHAARTTLRLLESLVRLAQAHAKLMAKHRVDVADAAVAVALVDSSVVDGEAVLRMGVGVGLAAPGDQFHEAPDAAVGQLAAAVEAAVLRAVREAAPAAGLLQWNPGSGDGGGGGGGNGGWG